MQRSVILDSDLIRKYDVLAPRYTSYPTAPQFHSEFGERQYETHAQKSNASLLPKDLSVYVHIPFCHSLCYFCGCNKVVTQSDNKKVDQYLESLFDEMALRGKLFNDDRLVTQIHFGGGTPNFLRLDQIADILDQIAIQFHLDLPRNLEIGIELDPRSVTPQEIENLAGLGFNRFSIGVQDFSTAVQKAVNREQNEAATLDAIAAAIKVGQSVNIDLITGLPKQTLESFDATLDKIIDSGASRIAAYNFAYLPERIKAQRMIDADSLPEAGLRLDLSQLVRQRLLAAGYLHIGMDHYALPEDSLAVAMRSNTLQRNFQGYTTHKDTDLIGIGASAISKFDTAFAQNQTQLSLYGEQVDAQSLPVAKGLELNDDDRIRAEIIQQIMCRHSVDLTHNIGRYLEQDRNLSLREYFDAEVRRLQGFVDDGLVQISDQGFSLTESGRFFMRPIAATFDRYMLPSNDPSKDQIIPFSRTV